MLDSLEKGHIFEDAVYNTLKDSSLFDEINRNMHIPKINGGFTEIDLVCKNKKDIFCIECKNYKGWIIGKENDTYWKSVIYKKTSYFFNPIKQNLLHTYNLRKYLKLDKPCKSIIVFSNEATLKNIQIFTEDIKVVLFKDLINIF